jgi:hypothetical protein
MLKSMNPKKKCGRQRKRRLLFCTHHSTTTLSMTMISRAIHPSTSRNTKGNKGKIMQQGSMKTPTRSHSPGIQRKTQQLNTSILFVRASQAKKNKTHTERKLKQRWSKRQKETKNGREQQQYVANAIHLQKIKPLRSINQTDTNQRRHNTYANNTTHFPTDRILQQNAAQIPILL